jgi:cysteinyl-tRNA synthetase
MERGDPSPKAPPVEEIEQMIDQRNQARRQCNFTEADRIRRSLHEKGVALMDEPGARGKGAEVTTWRYWRE